jgi:hypothetical protein
MSASATHLTQSRLIMRRSTPFSAAALPLLAITLAAPLEASASTLEPPPPELHDASANEPYGSVRVQLDLTGVSDELATELRTLIAAELERQAAELGLTVEQPPRGAELLIAAEINVPKGAPMATVSSVAILATPERARRVGKSELQTCMRCSAEQLLEHVLMLLPAAAVTLREHVEAERAAAADARREEEERAAAAAAATAATAKRRRLGPVGYTGIGLTALGIGAGFAGGALLARGKVVVEGTAVYLDTLDYRPPGWALLAGGLVAAALGPTLLGVDLGILEPRRANRRRAELSSIAPMFGDGFGIGLSGRF